MRWLDGITVSVYMSLRKFLGDSEGQGSLVCCSPLGFRVAHDIVTEQQQPKIFHMSLVNNVLKNLTPL